MIIQIYGRNTEKIHLTIWKNNLEELQGNDKTTDFVALIIGKRPNFI